MRFRLQKRRIALPTMDRLVFALLLLAVPLQYFILGFSMPKFLTDVTSMILPPIDMDAWLPSWIGLVAWLTEGKSFNIIQ